MAVRRVDDEDIDPRVDQGGGPLAAVRARADRRADAQPPLLVLDGLRILVACRMSLIVMRPASRPSASTTRSFSIRCLCKRRLASSTLTPGGTVTSSFVISALTG